MFSPTDIRCVATHTRTYLLLLPITFIVLLRRNESAERRVLYINNRKPDNKGATIDPYPPAGGLVRALTQFKAKVRSGFKNRSVAQPG